MSSWATASPSSFHDDGVLLEPGDEVLLPAPDYPLWTAAVVITGAKPVYYPCRPEAGFIPDPEEVARLVTPRCKALVLINPNNPTGAVYPREVVEAGARRRGEEDRSFLRRDLQPHSLRRRRARAGGNAVPGHALRHASAALQGLSRLRVSHRLGLFQRPQRSRFRLPRLPGSACVASSLLERARAMGGADRARRRAEHLRSSPRPPAASAASGARYSKEWRIPFLSVQKPMGAFYAFVGARTEQLPGFDDGQFAMALLEKQHVLVAPGPRSTSTTRTTSE